MNHVIRGYDGQFDISIPVVVIGAGAAGLIAGLAAHDNGAQLLIVAVSYTHLTLPTINSV